MAELPFAKKSLGQHWLTDRPSLESMCEAAEVTATDTVLEIGPGLGALTHLLVRKAKRVIAVEFDAKLAQELPRRVEADNLEIICQDILSFDFTGVPAPYKVVANIPYYLTSNLVRVISETPNPPQTVVLLVQKEVAERIAAKPGDLSILSVTAQYYWKVGLGPILPAYLFTPPPKVDSRIIILKQRVQPLFSDIDTNAYFQLVKAGFGQRRKTLVNSLGNGLHLSKQTVLDLCKQADIEPSRRAQTLNLEEWYKLYQAWHT